MEKYFEIKFIQEYILPIILVATIILILLLARIVSGLATRWEEREKRINDKLWNKYGKEDPDGQK